MKNIKLFENYNLGLSPHIEIYAEISDWDVHIVLFDTIENDWVGLARAERVSNTKFFELNIFHSKGGGYGNLLQELICTAIYPNSLVTDRSGYTSKSALKAWKRLIEKWGDNVFMNDLEPIEEYHDEEHLEISELAISLDLGINLTNPIGDEIYNIFSEI
jgi:hypothetical protein